MNTYLKNLISKSINSYKVCHMSLACNIFDGHLSKKRPLAVVEGQLVFRGDIDKMRSYIQ